MAYKGMELVIAAVVVVGMVLGGASAQLSCTTQIMNLSPCLNYITGNSSTPSSSCCSKLSDVVQSSPQCLCSLLNNGGSVSLGITINRTLALSLPGACNVNTPPISQCQAAANGPTVSAAPSESPEGDITPSASDIPSGGSKTIPSTDGGDASGGSSISRATPLHFMLFFFLILSCASSATLSN